MIREITKHIADNVSGLTIGLSLFSGHLPEDAPDECSVVLETGIGLPDPYLKDSVEKTIQVYTRGREYYETRDRAYAIYNFLNARRVEDLPVVTTGVEYRSNVVRAINQPQPLSKDEKGLWQFSTNFVFRIENK